MLPIQHYVKSIRFGGRHWWVQVWDEDLGDWKSSFRSDAEARICRHTATVLVRERSSYSCPAFGREVEILQIQIGRAHV